MLGAARSHVWRGLTEASLFTRQGAEQLPELGEGQLPVVVLVQGAHQLRRGPGITGVLWVITDQSRARFNAPQQFQPREKSGPPPIGPVW